EVLFEALLGFRVTRHSYISRIEPEERQGTRDLARLAELGLLEAHGHTKGRFYAAGPVLVGIRGEIRTSRKPLADPYPALMGEIKSQEALAGRKKDAEPLF
ncbi:MAG: hypothetical protein LBI99_09915, partial [Propionibacteriaceae bacterium]|nr:hypothetical protein [Propionibacteriaceae bacterium]